MMMANPPWTNKETNHHNTYSGNMTTPLQSSVMKHNNGFIVKWTSEEDKDLVKGLASYSSGLSRRSLYVKLALGLQGKNARDVAARCRWLNRNENPKRRKEDHNGLGTARADNNMDIPDMAVASQVSEPSQHGINNELLQQNVQLLSQISANMTSSSTSTLMDNANLFKIIRNNINTLVDNLNENVPEIMKRMPALPEKLNEELFSEIERASLPETNPPKLP